MMCMFSVVFMQTRTGMATTRQCLPLVNVIFNGLTLLFKGDVAFYIRFQGHKYRLFGDGGSSFIFVA